MMYVGCPARRRHTIIPHPFSFVLAFLFENRHNYLSVRTALKLEVANQWLHSVFNFLTSCYNVKCGLFLCEILDSWLNKIRF